MSNLVEVNINGATEIEPGELILKNTYGQILRRQADTDKLIDLQQLAPGIYIIEWWTANHKVTVQKLIKS